MNLVKVKPKFQVTIPANLRKGTNLQEGDFMEAVRIDEGILFKFKLVVDRNTIVDRIASTLMEARESREDKIRSEDEIMEDTSRKFLHHAANVMHEGSIGLQCLDISGTNRRHLS